MRKELKTIEQIELYLSNRLNYAEKLKFENQLAAEPELKSAVDNQKIIQERIRVNAFRKVLVAHTQENHIPRGIWKQRLLFLGLILILLAIFSSILVLFFFKNKQEGHATLVQSNTEVIADEVLEMIPEDSVLIEKECVSNKMEKKQFAKAKDFIIPQELQVPFESVMLNIDKGDTIEMRDSKSLIYIAPSSMRAKNGTLVKGLIELRYREFRAIEDMIFADIPMIYKALGEGYRFNSAGMFEIRAFQDGMELEVIPEKPMLVDYYVTKVMEDLSFFALDDESQNWARLRDIDFGIALLESELVPTNPFVYDTAVVDKTPSFKGGFQAYQNYLLQNETYQKVKEIGLGTKTDAFLTINGAGILEEITFYNFTNKASLMDSIAFIIYKDLEGFESGKIDGDFSEMKLKVSLNIANKASREVFERKGDKRSKKDQFDKPLQLEQLRALVAEYFDSLAVQRDSSRINFLFDEMGVGNKFNLEQNRKANRIYELGDTLLQARPDTALQAALPINQNYSNLVRALSLANFGVYNCDQIYRIQQPLAIKARYVDENQEKLTPKYLSLVDFTLNAAFMYNPVTFVMNKNSPTVLFLLNDQGEAYTLDAKSLQEMNIQTSGQYTFQLKNQKDKLSTKNNLIEILRVINN